jgi:hypothetical protein
LRHVSHYVCLALECIWANGFVSSFARCREEPILTDEDPDEEEDEEEDEVDGAPDDARRVYFPDRQDTTLFYDVAK